MKTSAVCVHAVLLAVLVGPLDRAVFATTLQEQEGPEDGLVERPALAIPPGYRYDPAGRRDPFVNPVPPPVVVETSPVLPELRPQGLPGVLLNEAQLMGVVTSSERAMNVVVIQVPGNRTFIARPGDEMFDVIISEIRPGSVVFEVKPLEGEPEPAEREEVERPVSAAPGE
jgi:hypothetical protein